MITIAIFIGVFSYNATLPRVAINRQTIPVEKPISQKVDTLSYECLLGVPHGYKALIGHEMWAKVDGQILGPFLVVDVEAPYHHPHMRDNGLASDTNCEKLAHKKVKLFLVL